MSAKFAMVMGLLLISVPVSNAFWGEVFAGAVCVVAAPFAVPAALGAAGFTAGGIAAGSMAATAMSYAAPVAAGGAVAMAQSVEAAGVGTAGKVIAFGVGSAVYHAVKDD